ncbi:MAG: hypothetical protein LKG97_11105, partial [Acetobacter peroxydans]|nr:hypothetical protein [Acetobacter peroxydans]
MSETRKRRKTTAAAPEATPAPAPKKRTPRAKVIATDSIAAPATPAEPVATRKSRTVKAVKAAPASRPAKATASTRRAPET